MWTISDVKTAYLWDIFCRVIDNFGDVGVCWRLATGLAARGQKVRLWVDDPAALAWMAPEGAASVEVRRREQPLRTEGLTPGDVLLEAFGCDIDPGYLTAFAAKVAGGQSGLWLNLEHLSAEPYVERCHALPSPVLAGPGKGLPKYFFFPGFTPTTGGLLRETDLTARQTSFDREAWLRDLAIGFGGERLVSLFCYEPEALGELLKQLAADPLPTRLLVTAGRAAAAVKTCLQTKDREQPGWTKHDKLLISYLPWLSQSDFDCLLWSCDLNFVRGEDSVVRALWAGKPFVWQLYRQTDNAHRAKLEAFLNLLDAPASLRAFHQVWNGFGQAALPTLQLNEWQPSVCRTRALQLQQDDLVTKIIQFAAKNR